MAQGRVVEEPEAGASLPAAIRLVVAGAPIALFGAAFLVLAWQLVDLVGVDDWGSDWRWLEDGLQRLAAGQPLVRPEYANGPFSQFPNGAAYTWSLHPPSTATLVAPSLLLPAWLREPVWTALMALAFGAAVWLAWPRRLWWGTQLLLAAVFLGPPYLGLSKALTDQLHFANPNALVVLGVVLVWLGRRHGSVALIAGGLVLAAVKIVPAIGLGAWLLADRRRGRAPSELVVPALLWAAAILVALTVPILAIDPGALADTIASQANLVPWPGEGNLAPSVRLAPLLGLELATWLSRIVGLALLGVVIARRLDGAGGLIVATAAPLLLTPQLWAHWFLVPAVAALIAAAEWPALRTFDRRLRLAWLGVWATGSAPVREA